MIKIGNKETRAIHTNSRLDFTKIRDKQTLASLKSTATAKKYQERLKLIGVYH